MNNTKWPNQNKSYSDTSVGIISNLGNTQQSIGASTLTTISLPTIESPKASELYDFSTANTIKVKQTGKYNITFSMWTNTSGGNPSNRYIQLTKNAGATVIGEVTGHQLASTNTGWSTTNSWVVDLVENEYIYINYFSTTTTSQIGVTGYLSGVMPILTIEYIYLDN